MHGIYYSLLFSVCDTTYKQLYSYCKSVGAEKMEQNADHRISFPENLNLFSFFPSLEQVTAE